MTTLTDIVADAAILTEDSTDTVTNKTITSAANTLSLDAGDLTSGTVAAARLGSGTANATTFLRGDNSWAAAGGLYLTESENTASPNATVPVNSLSATSSATNADVAIVPKGTGAILANIPDSSTIGGDKRGDYAVDLCVAPKPASSKVASGNYSALLAGYNNSATGTYSAVVGAFGCSATGNHSACIGSQNSSAASQSFSGGGYGSVGATGTASVSFGSFISQDGAYSAAFGLATENNRWCTVMVGSYGPGGSSVRPSASTMQCLSCETTDATATRASSNATSTGDTYEVRVRTNSAHIVRFLVVGTVTGGGDTKAWELVACLKRGASGVPSIVGSVTKTVIAADAGASAWDVDVSVGSTDAYTVEVTGAAATTISWSVSAFTSESRF